MKKGKKAKCNISLPHGRTSCTLAWGLWKKKVKKKMPSTLFHESKLLYKKKKKKNKDKSFHSP